MEGLWVKGFRWIMEGVRVLYSRWIRGGEGLRFQADHGRVQGSRRIIGGLGSRVLGRSWGCLGF